ncbi:hypothetical protein DERP_014606 [Dermatophagoides pteronyssinus]|uniref:Uncharacterized protein n=1 Tax=Dermatophagoides pteronyssinus TaxID=6956 RepID=A0ABQ8IW92_DERPT|nr:hypothetical protein DERP_014606 [Dermatophagoides pteronyssinus]
MDFANNAVAGPTPLLLSVISISSFKLFKIFDTALYFRSFSSLSSSSESNCFGACSKLFAKIQIYRLAMRGGGSTPSIPEF